MGKFVYNLSIDLLAIIYRIVAVLNAKANLFVSGREGIFKKITAHYADHRENVVWFHCASLGEFEQGRPIIEAIKKQFPDVRILLTFFSPSGYENQKSYKEADAVFYLPWDTKKNAQQFVELTKPVLAIFIKYEFWYHYSEALKAKSVPLLSVSCILRPDQAIFKSYGSIFRKTLHNFDHFFVQNTETLELLKTIGIRGTLSGDTRFDRVDQLTKLSDGIEIVEKFKNNTKLMVAGSCWKEDIEVLSPFIHDNHTQLKFIIAPHELSEQSVKQIEESISVKSVRYSQAGVNVSEFDVLIIDNIGLLSRLYRYGEFAFIGGGFRTGLHNILEAACYGVPILFGNKSYDKFKEAQDLIMRGGAFDVSDYIDLKQKYESLNNHPENFLLACEVTRAYVEENIGATKKVMEYCSKILSVK
jgi:3-deoxy-D-manno-octulosonic-acid transferase